MHKFTLYTCFVYFSLDIFEYRVGCKSPRLEKFDQYIDQIMKQGNETSKSK